LPDIENKFLEKSQFAENEIQRYLLAANGVGCKTSIFMKLIKSKTIIPNITTLAQSCPSTSADWNRVLFKPPKRGNAIQEKVMIHKSMRLFEHISTEEMVADWQKVTAFTLSCLAP
jgi:hypothetical protein